MLSQCNFMSRREPFILFTDDQCIIGGTTYSGLPMLVNYNHDVLEAPSDWLRYLRVMKGEAEGSVRQFAYHLKCWWKYLNTLGIAWDMPDDFVMMNWREKIIRDGCNDLTANAYISTVFRFYLWTERSGRTHGLIGEPDFKHNTLPPLSVDEKFGPKGTKIYSSPFLKKTSAQPILPTPTNDEITKVHEALAEMYGDNDGLLIRDTIILSWMEQTGMRRAEIRNLTVRQVPGWDEIYTLQTTGDKKEITVVGKGNKRRSIWAGADLLIQTREYIEEERMNVVNRCHARLGTIYKKPKEIFLSSKTGLPLNPDSISQIFAQAFRKAGVNGSGHRVRARFLTNLAGNTFECELEKQGSVPDLTSILLPVAQIAGHNSVESLKPYLAIARKRLLLNTNAERAAAAESREVAAKRRLSSILVRLKTLIELRALVAAIESGNMKQVIAEVQKLQNIYTNETQTNLFCASVPS